MGIKSTPNVSAQCRQSHLTETREDGLRPGSDHPSRDGGPDEDWHLDDSSGVHILPALEDRMTDDAHRCLEPVSQEFLSRERWREHPYFPSQTLLLGSHQNFRRRSKALVEASPLRGPAAGELAGSSLGTRQHLFDQWQGAMRSHEHYEEHKLYPFLRHRFGVKTAALEQGHEALHVITHDLGQAFDNRDDSAWATAMARFDVVPHEHLRDEEDLVIPCLLSLKPREFSAYYHGSLPELLAETAPCAC